MVSFFADLGTLSQTEIRVCVLSRQHLPILYKHRQFAQEKLVSLSVALIQQKHLGFNHCDSIHVLQVLVPLELKAQIWETDDRQRTAGKVPVTLGGVWLFAFW